MYALYSLIIMDMTDQDFIDVKRAGFDLAVNASGVASTSRGLVGDTVFAVIPNVAPSFTFIITIAFQAVCTFTCALE